MVTLNLYKLYWAPALASIVTSTGRIKPITTGQEQASRGDSFKSIYETIHNNQNRYRIANNTLDQHFYYYFYLTRIVLLVLATGNQS